MKPRIKLDIALLFLVIVVMTGLAVRFPFFYPRSIVLDGVLDFAGLWLILAGIFIRMASRGHKKAHSSKGYGLVTTGPYALTRNPMYLGSFLLGTGFVLSVWPWFNVLIFVWAFYLRFNVQMVKEEKQLGKFFGKSYEDYFRRVPRIFPRWEQLKKMKFKEVLPLDEIWSTKERTGLFLWPLLVVSLEVFREKIVFHTVPWDKTIFIFGLSVVTFGLVLFFLYKKDG